MSFEIENGILKRYIPEQNITEVIIPDNINVIGSFSFMNNPVIRRVIIPKTVKQIEKNAFSNCISLEEITIPGNVVCIGELSFAFCKNLKSVKLSEGLVEICDNAFLSCNNLSKINIPDSIRNIGYFAFGGCEKLIDAENKSEVERVAFDGCLKLALTEYDQKLALTDLYDLHRYMPRPFFYRKLKDNEIFDECRKKSWNNSLEDKIISMNPFAVLKPVEMLLMILEECQDEKNKDVYRVLHKVEYGGDAVKTLSIPDEYNIRYIGYQENAIFALSDCNCEKIVLPKTAVCISKKAFFKNTNVRSVVIPDSVEYIDNCAFMGCSSLESVFIPDSVKRIGDRAFSYCGELKEVRISGKCEIGFDVFLGCQIENIIYPTDIIPAYEILKSTLLYSNQPDGDIYYNNCYLHYKGEMTPHTTVVIKEGTKAICGLAFVDISTRGNAGHLSSVSKCSSLESVIIPDGLKTLCKNAFYNCVSLKSINIPDSVSEIGGGAFAGCISLETVHLPAGINEIVEETFYGCSSLKNVVIPYGVKKIGERAFSGCKSLTSVVIPDTVTEIDKNAFKGCPAADKLPERFRI